VVYNVGQPATTRFNVNFVRWITAAAGRNRDVADSRR
jgi:hypothetical protein